MDILEKEANSETNLESAQQESNTATENNTELPQEKEGKNHEDTIIAQTPTETEEEEETEIDHQTENPTSVNSKAEENSIRDHKNEEIAEEKINDKGGTEKNIDEEQREDRSAQTIEEEQGEAVTIIERNSSTEDENEKTIEELKDDDIQKKNDEQLNITSTTEQNNVDTKPKTGENRDDEKETVDEEEDEEKRSDGDQSENVTAAEQNSLDNEGDEEREKNPVFVHVNTEKDDGSKDGESAEQVQEDEDFRNSQPQEDPIASDVQESPQDDDLKDSIEGSAQGADEELCIIPDTERVISQEERDAASALIPKTASAEPEQTDSTLGEEDKDDSDCSSGKFIITPSTDDALHSCIQCLLPRKAKYISMREDRTLYICDDTCLDAFKEDNPGKTVTNQVGDLWVKNLISETNTTSSLASNIGVFIRKCAECNKKISSDDESLSWETMDFCNELCLSKYQRKIGSNCSNCSGDVRPNCLGKYSVRFGYDIRQFCSSVCLEEYKKGLKVCSYCQKDISAGVEGFLAPAGDKGQFKDFCSSSCMERYNVMSQHKKPVVKPGVTCSVCLLEKPISIEYEHDSKMSLFCGEPCFVAFKFVNNIVPGKCDMCGRFFDFKVLEQHTIFYDDMQHSFCSKSCQNIYIIANRRIVPCCWCKVKKYNFDMIKRYSCSGPSMMMCSLGCLSLYQVSINAVNLKKTQCDHCFKCQQPMYHLTMSDATTRNFCSYNCVMAFQNQFSKKPLTLSEHEVVAPVPTGAPKRSRRQQSKETTPELPALPVISNVQSLAPPANGSVSPTPRTTRSRANTGVGTNTSTPSGPPQVKHHILIKPAPLPQMRNMLTMCKPVMFNKSMSISPELASKECQTDEVENIPKIIPVPVPIYIPVPLPMFTTPYPTPAPFPLPVPVPVFIPTTRNSASGIMKEIKKIQVKIPADPFEAELLMMAEMVAGDKKEENTDSESDDDAPDATVPPADESGTFSPEPVDASNSFGDDMLQMALKMASELDEPAVDLEGALTANTITASQGNEAGPNEDNPDDPQPLMARHVYKGSKKRAIRTKSGVPSKRGRRTSQAVDTTIMQHPQHVHVPPEPVEKPDANMCLKYTFGVNAWKQWVTTKNAELEKSSRRVKLFKPEILQLTADELNYSLCLFVKEVRKPNGTEYAPDTIYYLCLGIQQYLFENGRIDNIFCDAYYEKFTDCLDEVARKFSVLYNDSHYIVTRVEEEHLWESKQLGAHSPHVLLSTLMFFNTKHFNLTTVDEHMQLSFSHIMKHWKRNPNQPGTAKTPGSRNVLLRFYPPQTAIANSRKKKVYEQQENEENPLRCPVKLYEFYLSKCPESVKTRNDVFYLQPERSCVPDSPVWYSTMPLGREALEKMLHRVKMVKEINVALLTS